MLDRALALHPQVALRPEPFGALAYHYGNRRLIFLKHPDVVAVVRALGDHPSLQATLDACGVAESRWPAFDRALTSLVESEMLVEREPSESPTTVSPATVPPTAAGAIT